MTQPTIGKLWAICDHFELDTGKPVLASILKKASGVTRWQLRKWVREGRLNEFDVTDSKGNMQKAYSRPKADVADAINNSKEA